MTVLVVEGDTDLPYVRKLAISAGLEVSTEIDAGGKDAIDRDLAAYNRAAKGMPWVVVRDLDHDAECGGAFVERLGIRPSRWFRFRLAVRELESWVLADATGFARFIGVDVRWLPENPDAEEAPTETLLRVASRAPAAVRRKLLPARGASARVGPLYEATLIEFGERVWNVTRASKRSRSLERARIALRALATEWNALSS